MAWRIWRGDWSAVRGLTMAARRQPPGAADLRHAIAAGPGQDPGRGRQEPATPAEEGNAERRQVPRWLETAAGWSWRLLLLGLLIYLAARIASALRIVVLPCVAALLLTALLQPLASRFKRAGLPSLLAAWCVLILALGVIAGLGTLIYVRVSAEYPTLVTEVRHTGHQLQHWLAGPPFHVSQTRLQSLLGSIGNEIRTHKTVIAGTVLTGGRIAIEIVAGIILTLFVGFFLIKDGDRIWAWLTGFLGPDKSDRAERAGRAAWQVLVYYVRGTVLIGVIHSTVIGLTLWILGVPLVIPLAVLVFLASFVPLVGILVAGAAAIAVTLGTRGWIAAVVLLAVFLVENQLEGHLLQPQVVGRMVRLHPLAVILVLAVGGVIAGIAGAVVAVPTTAAIVRAWPELRRRAPGPRHGAPPGARDSGTRAAAPGGAAAGPGVAGAGRDAASSEAGAGEAGNGGAGLGNAGEPAGYPGGGDVAR